MRRERVQAKSRPSRERRPEPTSTLVRDASATREARALTEGADEFVERIDVLLRRGLLG